MVSKQTLDFIKRWEGFRSNAYLCPAGVPTIGYGTTRIDGRPVKLGMTITQDKAESILLKQVADFQKSVLATIKVPVTENQITALVSFAYNIGLPAFRRSTLLKLLNSGNDAASAEQFLRWVYAGGKVLAGLMNRRKEERALFMKVG